ncbi:MAG: UDP-3-O-(3-hydroxymyristoyl)glucosamine N-acyltransferase [Gammaproteobacteria bacterium]|nr:UDP-3-O-(3-hydroxymyristoyl)glucosamine N-acyltransferase [Gammaproteobacteria bacterium]
MKRTAGEIAEHIGGRLVGDPLLQVSGCSPLTSSRSGTITFIASTKFRKYLASTTAAVLILKEADSEFCPVDHIIVDDPYYAYAQATELFIDEKLGGVIHPSAVVDESASIGTGVSLGANAVIGANVTIAEGCSIGPGVVLGDSVVIGRDSTLNANVTIYANCQIGERAIVHSGAVIGADGFGFANHQGEWVKIHQLGRVVIGDDVEIGANTAIDRGAIDDTIIEDGVKLDNQIQIGHNCHIGAHTAIASSAAVAGSTIIGKQCAIGGLTGFFGHLEVADNVTLTAMSAVTKSIKDPGHYASGTPLQPYREWQKNFSRFKQLDEMSRRIRLLEKELTELKGN